MRDGRVSGTMWFRGFRSIQHPASRIAPMLFHDVTLVLPDRLVPGGWLRADPDTGRIVALGGPETPAPPRPGRGEEYFNHGHGRLLLAPGLIDAHVHGAVGRDAMEATPAAWAAIAHFHALAGGTTALALTTVAAPTAAWRRVLTAARDFPVDVHAPRLLGIHLEGPFLSPARAGAHDPAHLHAPADVPAETAELLTFADVLTQVTLAPEIPGAGPFAEALRARGVLVSAGHSDGLEDDFPPGTVLRHVTHLFNAMSAARRPAGSAFRQAGLTEIALADPTVVCELIADGRHVSPALLRLAFRAKGADGLCLVTDATAGAGLPEGAAYRLGQLPCTARDGVGMTDNPSTGVPALAGSTATMLRCVHNMVELAGASVPEAVRMATLNPARALGIADERGQLAAGLAADLIVLDAGLNEVHAVFIGGRRLENDQ